MPGCYCHIARPGIPYGSAKSQIDEFFREKRRHHVGDGLADIRHEVHNWNIEAGPKLRRKILNEYDDTLSHRVCDQAPLFLVVRSLGFEVGYYLLPGIKLDVIVFEIKCDRLQGKFRLEVRLLVYVGGHALHEHIEPVIVCEIHLCVVSCGCILRCDSFDRIPLCELLSVESICAKIRMKQHPRANDGEKYQPPYDKVGHWYHAQIKKRENKLHTYEQVEEADSFTFFEFMPSSKQPVHSPYRQNQRENHSDGDAAGDDQRCDDNYRKENSYGIHGNLPMQT